MLGTEQRYELASMMRERCAMVPMTHVIRCQYPLREALVPADRDLCHIRLPGGRLYPELGTELPYRSREHAMTHPQHGPLHDPPLSPRLKLGDLWASLMFCYVYGDYFGLYVPGKLGGMLAGRMEPLGAVTQGVLLGTSAMMAIPALMVCAALLLPAAVARWASVLFGLAYAAIMLLTMPGAWRFYLFFGVIEVLLSLGIVWVAWCWPRRAPAAA